MKAFEAAKKAYETAKSSAQEKWKIFMHKFEGAKSEASNEISKAETPDDLIAIGMKIQQQGEALKAEEESVKHEKEKENQLENEMLDQEDMLDYEQGVKEQESSDMDKQIELEALKQAKEASEAADQEKIAELRAKLRGEEIPAKDSQQENAESNVIDAVEINNRIVAIRDEKERMDALNNLSEAEISAVSKLIANSNWDTIFSRLSTFGNKTEIVSSPELSDKFKEMLCTGRVHIYDIDTIQSLPGISEEMLNDDGVKKGIMNSVRSFVSYQNASEWPHISSSLDRVVKSAKMSSQDLHNIAEELKATPEAFNLFVRHFGAEKIYSQL